MQYPVKELESEQLPIKIVIPVFNDWESLEILLQELASTFVSQGLQADVLVVDDASTKQQPHDLELPQSQTLSVSLLKLRRNLGHQRAIAIGLAYIEDNLPCKAVLIMDGDGEDQPVDAARLVHQCVKENYSRIVFAKRTKRSEGLIFRVFYIFYKAFYRLLTGQKIDFGNFSIVPCSSLQKLVVVSDLWNHYVAAILKSKILYSEIPCARGKRFTGKSKMNFVSLTIHGLSAISVFSDVLGVRLLILSTLLIFAAVTGIAIVIFMKLFTEAAILGWASTIVSLFFVIMMQAILISLFFIFSILGNRNNAFFIPRRDYKNFVLDFQDLSAISKLSKPHSIYR